ncbi:hypothetical protein DNTS_005287 [Danionella cerebrum]|uniref:Uncharacterized protein n=1 Tax=Danionella cerebrum TaxID=2873325 RepID=A0A553R8U5_9TELE|nr:hypothetical protein DNTS_005287 [Danionella translucida]
MSFRFDPEEISAREVSVPLAVADSDLYAGGAAPGRKKLQELQQRWLPLHPVMVSISASSPARNQLRAPENRSVTVKH